MNIPFKIKVGGKIYDIYKSNIPVVLNNQECGGIIDTEECQITINIKRNHQAAETHFLHECIHAICRDRGLDEIDEDENAVDNLARGLHAFIYDNPEIFNKSEP